MVIIRNIPAVVKFYCSLRHLTQYKKAISDARATGDCKLEQENILKATKCWGTQMLKGVGVTVDVKGRENLPKKGPVVYMSNHQGFGDIVVLCAVLDTVQIGFIAKESLAKVPLYGKWIDRVRSVMIRRGDPRESLKAINKAIELIKKDYSMVIFPEGTRSRSAKMAEFKKGTTKLATKPGVPIIPVSLNGTYRIIEETGKIKSAHVDVIIHEQIETKGISREEEKLLCQKVENIVREGVKELVEKEKS